MNNPNLLIISNRFSSEEIQETLVSVDFIKWSEGEKKLETFTTHDVVIIDFSFDDDEELKNIQKIYKELFIELGEVVTLSLINKKGLVVVVVCGYKHDHIYTEYTKYEEQKNEEEIYSYDFLQKFDKAIYDRFKFKESKLERYEKGVNNPFGEYFDFVINEPYCIFQYEPQEIYPNIEINPIFKTKGVGDTCIGVRIKIGNGLLILLPGYDRQRKKEALSSLIKISRYLYSYVRYFDIPYKESL